MASHIHIPKPTTIDLVGGIYCHICQLTYPKKKDYDDHYASHKKGVDGKDIVYTCVVCHIQIKGYPCFRGHCYSKHVIHHRHQCEHCFKFFSKLSSLKEHIKVIHTFKCSTCSKKFSSKNELKLHQVIHNESNSPPYHCQVCEVQIVSLEGCKDHIDMHTVFIYSCPICNENISSKNNAVEHLKIHFDNIEDDKIVENVLKADSEETSIEFLGGISCSYCTVVFKNKVEFKAHFLYEHGDRDIEYMCGVCDKKFEKYSLFAEHAYNHSTKDRFTCSKCSKTHNRLSLLVTHMAVCQGSGKPFACPECGNRYITEQSLRKHLRDKHGLRCVECPVENCQKKFSTPKELIFHMYVHDSHQNWCRKCCLPFTSLNSCERHLDVHRKKIFGCPVCNRNYGEKYLLMNHITQHFESVLHICKVCGKVSNNRRSFLYHMKTHNETKVHNCSYCGKGFCKLDALQQHLNIHTGSKPYKCTICTKSFACYPNWAKHKRRMHNLESSKTFKEIAENYTDEEAYVNPEECEEGLPKDDGKNNNVQDTNIDVSPSTQNFKNANQVDESDLNHKNFIYHGQDDSNELKMKPETLNSLYIEKELQILENITENGLNVKNEFADALSTSGTLFDNVVAAESPNILPSLELTNFPPEYGPEFTVGDSCGFLDLDDHMLPHIDPLLTIKTEEFSMTQKHCQNLTNYSPMDPGTYQVAPMWEPPVFKACPEYSYGYGMVDSNRLTTMNTDIF